MHLPRIPLLAALLFGASLVAVASGQGHAMPPRDVSPPNRSAPYFFGDLVTMPAHAQYEARQGVSMAMLELNWALYEPGDGQFDAHYAALMQSELNVFLNAGMQITLGVGLSSPPSWLFDYPNSRFVNQDGALAGRGCSAWNEVNLIFNQVLREKADAYFDRINRDLGLRNFWAIRLTSGGDCEMVYPDVSVHGGSYWAFDVNAQNGLDMPPSMERNPFPGWKPGQRTYHGKPFTTAQVNQWSDWYIRALDNTADWQIKRFNSMGFQGYYQILSPGVGALPSTFMEVVSDYLPDSLVGVGAVWDRFYRFLPDKARVVAYVTSMADGSGTNDSCQPADDSVSLTDSAVNAWSATRWISRIADQYHLPKAGENPGYGMPASMNVSYVDQTNGGMMASAFRQMQSCHFQGIYWAHDARLWDGTLPFSLYAGFIAQTKQPRPASRQQR